MAHDRRRDEATPTDDEVASAQQTGRVGKRTLTMGVNAPRPLFRSARPTHDEIAETALSGSAAALPHRGLMERTFGRSLGHVEAHTGAIARDALGAVGADGVTVGHRMAFRDADPAPEVVAHELVHVLQHEAPGGTGGAVADLEAEAYAAEHAFARGETIQVRGSHAGSRPHFRWSMANPPPDMQPVDWGQTAAIPGPADPEPLQIGSNAHTGHAPPLPREPVDFNAHGSMGDSFGEDPLLQMTRDQSWAQFMSDVRTLAAGWPSMTEAITRFNHAERDPTLQSIDQFQAPAGGAPTDVAGMGSQQHVPRTGGGGTTVEDLFRPAQSAPGTAGGTDLQMSAADQRGLDRAAQDPATESQLNQVRVVEARVQQAVLEYQAAVSDLEAKAHAIEAAQARIQLTQAQQQQAQAQQQLQDLQAARAATTAQVLAVVRTTQALLTPAATMVGGASLAGRIPRPIAGTADNASHDVIGMIASKIVDMIYEDRINAADAALQAAAERVRAAVGAVDIAEYNRAVAEHHASFLTLRSKKPAVVAALTERREAYVNLSRGAASRSGGDAASQERIRAAIAAIPVVETVVARISDVQASFRPPTYSRESGIGAGMATAHGYVEPQQFARGYGLLRGYQATFDSKATQWNARLTSLQSVVHRLEGLGH